MAAGPDTPRDRASLLTAAGRGAVAVVVAEGAAAIAVIDAHFRPANRLLLRDQALGRIVFGHWHAGGVHREEVIVCRTMEQQIEVHCHGGVAAAERILAALAAGGCRLESGSDWLDANADCLLESEAELALSATATRRTAAILLDQRRGALRAEIEAIQRDLATPTLGVVAAARGRLAALLDRAGVGLHLIRPWQVAIAGRPNVGKSSLLNALAGYQRALVYDQPGTTRDVLAVETAVDGWPVRLTDAAGIRAAADPLEAAGVDRAKQQLAQADLVVWVLDAAALTTADLADPVAAARRELAAEIDDVSPVAPLVAVNKIDLIAAKPRDDAVSVSALTGAGLDDVLAGISRRLVPRPPVPNEAVPFNQRHVELIQTAIDRIDDRNPALAMGALALLVDDSAG